MLSKRLYPLVAGVFALLIAVGTADASTYQIESEFSSVALSGFGAAQGKFTEVSGTIVYDPMNVRSSSVAFSLPMKSLDVLADGREVHIKGHHFYTLGRHSDVIFKSSQVVPYGDRLMVTGTFTLLGVSRQVVLPVEILGRGHHPESGAAVAGFSAEVKIKLSDYGIDAWTKAAGILGDQITLKLKVVGVETKEAVTNRKSTSSSS